MRLTQDELTNITGRKRKSSQVRWFKDYLAIDVPADHLGPIITHAAYEDLVKKRLGVLNAYDPSNQLQKDRPRVKLIGAH